MPLFVQKQFEVFNVSGAYAAALVLAMLALVTLFAHELDPAQRDTNVTVSPVTLGKTIKEEPA